MTKHTALRSLAYACLSAAAVHADWQQNSLTPTSGIFGLGVVNTAVYAGTGVATGDGTGIMRSPGALEAWTAANQGFNSTQFFVQVFVTHGDKLFAGTKGKGIYVSTDGGQTWTFSGVASKNITGFAKGGGKLFASTKGDGVWVSTDDGATWKAAGNAGIASNKQMLTIGYAGTTLYSGSNGEGFFKSTDAGETWTNVDAALPNSMKFCRSILVTDEAIYLAYDITGIYRSTDNGATWTLHTKGLNHGTFRSLAKLPNGIALATEGGVYFSPDKGANWALSNTGISVPNINVIEAFGDKLLAGSNTAGLWIRPVSELTAASSISRPDPRARIQVTGLPGLRGFNAAGRAVLPGASHAPVLILPR